MFRFLRKHRTFVMVFLAVIVVILPFFGIGTTSMLPTSQDTIIKVNGRKITQAQFDQLNNQIMRQRPDMTPDQKKQVGAETMNELVREEVFTQEAGKYGIHATDQELQLELASIPAFQKENRFDAQTYVQAVSQAFGMRTQDFEKKQKRDIEARRVNQLVAFSIHMSDAEYEQQKNIILAGEKDKAVLKKWKDDPDALRKDLLAKERNLVFQDWINQLNSTLKVQIVSESFRRRLNGAAQ
jgi:peptidyl-prolyl cis-trans isomerase D